jgi:tetratricopeptide (TPR) repeat protein
MATLESPATGRLNIQVVQNVLLIWLDNNIDDKNDDCRNTIAQLRRVVNTINIFGDGDKCIQFIEKMDNQKACMIISGSLGEHIVPRIHGMSQVDAIFIFCGNKKRHEQWAKKWSKVKGVFTEISPICEALKQAAQQCEQNAIPMCFVATNDDVSKKNLDQLDPMFMYSQILKEILLTIKFEEKHIKEFIDYCRQVFAENEAELNNVKKFEKQYRDKTPIWWYTYECFLYPMLNCALRLMDVDLIIKIGFFIDDLHRHIEQLHNEQFSGVSSRSSFTVFRGQGLSKTDFERMTKTEGGLLSFNSFLSTSKDRETSLEFAHRAMRNPDLVGILFVMSIDPAKSTTPFASVNDVGYLENKEDEILFSMHTVFRICEITPLEGNRLFQVKLTLTSDNDKDLCALTDRIRQGTSPNLDGWFRLGSLLLDMGQFNKAQKVLEILLEQGPDEEQKGRLYHLLALTKTNQGEYREGIVFYEKSLEIHKKYLSPTHPTLATSYNNIGNAYRNLGDYLKALLFHEKALAIRKQSLPSNHRHLAMSYSNIGNVCCDMGEYSKALLCYEKDLAISQSVLPSTHPDLGISYNNIGWMYEKMHDYSKARSFYERAVDNGQHSLPPNHPQLQGYRRNLDRIKKKL